MQLRPSGKSLLVALALVMVGGCARPQPAEPIPAPPTLVVETGREVVLSAGRAFHFTDAFRGGENPEQLPISSDGAARLVLHDARVPVLSVPAPYQIRQTLQLPDGGTFRAGFGLTPGSWDKAGGGARFVVRLRTEEGTTELLSEEVSRWRGEDSPCWQPVALELPASDEPVEIELATETVGTIPGNGAEARAGSYAVWLDPSVLTPPVAPRPNVLLVVIDALRADHLGCYGYPRNTSPHLDRFARRSLLFEEASSQATWTFPSLHSLLTSSYRFVRGQRVGQLGPDGVPVQPISMPVSLQGSLRAAGYETLACVGGGFLDPVLGFDAGFDWYWSPSHTPMLANQLSVVMDRLYARRDQPFFLLLHTYEVHNYFQGWAHSIEDFDSGYLGPLTDLRRLMEATLHGDPNDLAPADLRYVHDLYDGEIKHTDRYLGLFLEWLRSQPGGDNTIIIVTADHGEALGGHGEMSHGGAPYRDQVRVPLLLSIPGKRPARLATPVALVDILPTVLDLLGEDIPAGVAGRSVHSLPPSGAEPAPIFAESRGAPIMAREGDWWYLTWRGEKEELYDIARDPQQRLNLADSRTEELEHMRGVLAALASKAARGHRIEVRGPRKEPVTIEISSASPPAYLDAPTLRPGDSVSLTRTTEPAKEASSDTEATPPAQWQATLKLGPGSAPHVLLIEPRSTDTEFIVSAYLGSAELPASRVHLGAAGLSPDSLPLTIGAGTTSVLQGEERPTDGQGETCEIWIWRPEYAAAPAHAPALDLDELPADLADQLRSLGYLQ